MAKADKKKDPRDEVEDSAVDDIMSAVESGDHETLKAALMDLIRSCFDRYDAGEE